MSVSVQARGGRFQLRVIHRLLPKPFFFTWPTREEATNYGQQLHALLERGIVPAELLAKEQHGPDPLLVEVIRAYTKAADLTPSDDALLTHMLGELVGVRAGQVTFAWADDYVRRLKAKRLAPGTIRKRIGALARVLDWRIRLATPGGQVPLANALRLLPRGYSAYSATEAARLVDADLPVPRDVARDRRLVPAEELAIMAALAGRKRDDRERALTVDPAFTLLLQLILHTGLRLREAYRLRVDQVDLRRLVIDVEGTKGHRGVLKPRTVPIVPALEPLLRDHLHRRVGLVFPFWDGTPGELKRTTARLSARFRALFDYAKVSDLTEHDLRLEATCRWVEMRGRNGTWAFSDVEICRIMAWKDTRMMVRYASLRGEDLAARLR